MSKNKKELQEQLNNKIKEREQVQNNIFEITKHISKINSEFKERILSTQERIRACSNSRPTNFDQSVSWPHVQSKDCPYNYAQFFADKEILEKELWKELDYIKKTQAEAVKPSETEKVQLQHQEEDLTTEINLLYVKLKCCYKNSILISKLTSPKNKNQKPCPLSKKRKLQKPCPKSKKK